MVLEYTEVMTLVYLNTMAEAPECHASLTGIAARSLPGSNCAGYSGHELQDQAHMNHGKDRHNHKERTCVNTVLQAK